MMSPMQYLDSLRSRLRTATLFALSACVLSAAGCEGDVELPTEPRVAGLSKSSITVGETVSFVGNNFLAPSEGVTLLEFEGVYYWENNVGELVAEDVPSFTIRPVYDGEFTEPGRLDEVQVRPGDRVLRWNRFGPYEVPFGANGSRPGTFKGTVIAHNMPDDGVAESSAPSEISLDIKPSILIRRLEPITGQGEDGEEITPGCDAPALRVFGGLPYILEVEAMGFQPAYWVYEIANINGRTQFTQFSHQASGTRDALGKPGVYENEILVFNQLEDTVDYSLAAVRITAIDANDNVIATALPVPVVRPLSFHYSGNRAVAEYYEPVPVYGPVVGGVGTNVTYIETSSESRQRAVSVSFTESVTETVNQTQMENWNSSYGQTTSNSLTNSEGVMVSESESSTEAYGTTINSSEAAAVSMSSSTGTDWGWNYTEGTSQEQFAEQMENLFGEVSTEISAETNGSVSIPGVAGVGGNIGTSNGASTTTGQQNSNGERVGASETRGSSMNTSENQTEVYGSVTTDGRSESINETYAVGRQSSINTNRSETAANSESVTYDMGGSQSISEGYSVGNSETWAETWTDTTTVSETFAINQKVPNARCAMVYRQTVRYVRTAQLYKHDLCGVRSLLSEMNFNEWSWSPNIVLGDDCEDELPQSNLPKAECFLACE